jgi:UDP-GlcNAc:undecaprenyl-phosphate GlcNAc-1-phosphate transferase
LWQRKSPFIGDRQHLHYQLINFGFTQSSAVSLIYLAQAFMVGTGLLLTYHSDLVVVGAFLAECGILAGFIILARMSGWKRPASPSHSGFGEIQDIWLGRFSAVWAASALGIEIGLSIFLLLGALFGATLQQDFSSVALAVAALTLISPMILATQAVIFVRIAVYVSGLLVLLALQPLAENGTTIQWAIDLFFVALALALAGIIRVTRRDLFQITPQDLLVAFFALAVPNLPQEWLGGDVVTYIFPRTVVAFYACEYLISLPNSKHIYLKTSSIICLLLIGIRGLMS